MSLIVITLAFQKVILAELFVILGSKELWFPGYSAEKKPEVVFISFISDG